MKRHGSFQVERFGRILVLRAYDSWNLETGQACVAELCRRGAELQEAPWALVTDLRDWGMSGLELREPITQLASRLDDLGRTHSAFLSDQQSELIEYLINTSVRVGTNQARLEFFTDESEAVDWLRREGFDTADYGLR